MVCSTYVYKCMYIYVYAYVLILREYNSVEAPYFNIDITHCVTLFMILLCRYNMSPEEWTAATEESKRDFMREAVGRL